MSQLKFMGVSMIKFPEGTKMMMLMMDQEGSIVESEIDKDTYSILASSLLPSTEEESIVLPTPIAVPVKQSVEERPPDYRGVSPDSILSDLMGGRSGADLEIGGAAEVPIEAEQAEEFSDYDQSPGEIQL